VNINRPNKNYLYDSFFRLLKEISINKRYNKTMFLLLAFNKEVCCPENKKYIASDKNLWAGPITGIIVNPPDDLIL